MHILYTTSKHSDEEASVLNEDVIEPKKQQVGEEEMKAQVASKRGYVGNQDARVYQPWDNSSSYLFET